MASSGWKTLPLWRRILIVLAVIVVAIILAAWIASILLRPHLPTHDQIVRQARAEAQLTGGAQVFATHCAACHAHKIGPYLGGLGLDAGTVKTFVRNGPGPMPAFPASQVSDADIAAVAAYLGTLPSQKDDAK